MIVKLPQLAGQYIISYVKSIPNDKRNIYFDISPLYDISVSIPIYPYSPDESLTMLKEHFKLEGPVRRRLAGTIDSKRKFYSYIEIFGSIGNVNINSIISKSELNKCNDDNLAKTVFYTKIAAWYFKGQYKSLCSDDIPFDSTFLVETDLVYYNTTGELQTDTAYIYLNVPKEMVINSIHSVGKIELNNENQFYFNFRLKYENIQQKSKNPEENNFVSYKCNIKDQLQNPDSIQNMSIECNFCKAELISKGKVQKSDNLPSGLFDHVTTN